MQAYDLCRGNSELALALPLEPWVLNTTLQGFCKKEQTGKN